MSNGDKSIYEEQNVDIKIITDMYSHGAQIVLDASKKNYSKKVEFRLPELKAEMRYWWRVWSSPKNIGDLRKEEDTLFGSTENSSPILLKMTESIENCNRELDENFNIPITQQRKEISERERKISINTKNLSCLLFVKKNSENDINYYIQLMHLASILGGLGKGKKKGNGSFYIGFKNNVIEVASKEELSEKIKEIVNEIFGRNVSINQEKNSPYISVKPELEKPDLVKLNISKLDWKNKSMIFHPCIEEILIGDPISIECFEKQRVTALKARAACINKNTYLCKNYAPYVCITCYPSCSNGTVDGNNVFPIIIFLKDVQLVKTTNYETKNKNQKNSYGYGNETIISWQDKKNQDKKYNEYKNECKKELFSIK